MTVLLVLAFAAMAVLFRLVDRATATTRARAVPVSARMAEARRIAAGESAYRPPAERGSVEFRS
jgi:hypothetical protein